MILHGTDGTTPRPIFGCFVSHWACFATWMSSGFLDEAMRLTFTSLANPFVAHPVSAALEPVEEFPERVQGHCFALPPDLQPRRSHRRVSVGYCIAELESRCCYDRWGRCLVGFAAPS